MRSELSEAQRRAIREAMSYEPGRWLSLCGVRQPTVLALWRRGLVEVSEQRFSGTEFFRLTEAGRLALAERGREG